MDIEDADDPDQESKDEKAKRKSKIAIYYLIVDYFLFHSG